VSGFTAREYPGRAGFTLIEVLVATALSAVIMMALFSMFSSVADVSMDIRTRQGESAGERAFESILFDDLRSLYAAPGDVFEFSGKSGSFLGVDGVFLSFCTSASLNVAGSGPSLSLNRVEYLLREQGDAKEIHRRERSYCGVSGDWEWVDVLVVSGVQEVEVEYRNSTDNSLVSEWATGARYPDAVNVRLVYADQGEQSFTLGLSGMAGGGK
jgi:type II secretion system protein J